jgi:hypothetical protein
MWGTQRLNDIDPLHLARYASGADATGYPRSGDPHHYPAPVREPSRSEGPPEASVLIWSLGTLQ